MRPDVWYDRRVGDNVVRVRHFHNAPLRVQARPTEPAQIIILPVIRIERRRTAFRPLFGPFNDGGMVELPCDCGEPDKRERPPP
jgi:hypothetical protein